MAKTTPIIQAFNAGELSPLMAPRTDFAKYYSGCRTLENFIVLPQGGVTRRGGFHYVAEIKDSSKQAILVPFEFNVEQAYMLEFGDTYIRFYMNHGQIYGADANTVLLLHGDGRNLSTTIVDDGATGHTVTAAGNAKIKTDQKVFGSGSLYSPADGTSWFSIPDHADFNLGTGAFCFDTRVMFHSLPSAGSAVTIASQYLDADNSFSFFIDNSAGTRRIRMFCRASATTLLDLTANWTPTVDTWYHLAFIRGWGGNANDFAICVNGASVGTATANITYPDLGGGAAANVYLMVQASTPGYPMEGWLDEVRLTKGAARWTANFTPPAAPYPFSGAGGGSSVYEVTTTYTEDELPDLRYFQCADIMYHAHAEHAPAKLTRAGHSNWTLADVSFTAAPADWSAVNGYPRTVAGYQQRAYYAGTPTYPTTLWGSQAGDFEDMTVGTDPDDGFEFTLYADKVNRFEWMLPSRVLMIGTAGAEFQLSGTSDSAIDPTHIEVVSDTVFGSSGVAPVKAGSKILMVQRAKRKILEVTYSYAEDSYNAIDLTALAEHITLGGIEAICWQQEPYSMLWTVRADGVMPTLTYIPEQKIAAWARQVVGGSGEVEWAGIIPTPDGLSMECWIVVKRTINGSTKRYIEYYDPDISVDSGLTYSGAAITNVTGLGHLEGEEVAVLADGVVVTGNTVSSGAITLDTAAEEIQVGKSFTSTLCPMEINMGEQTGTVKGKKQRISEIVISLYESEGGKFGPDLTNLVDIPYPDGTTFPFSGDIRAPFDADWTENSTVYIVQDEPLPMTVLSISPVLNVNA